MSQPHNRPTNGRNQSNIGLAERMAADLRNLKIDLDRDVAVVRALMALNYTAREIGDFGDDAVELAKASQKNLRSIVGDGAAFVFAVGVWLAWYCVLCPAGA